MRMTANGTLLATGDVLVTGGVDDPGFLGLFAGFNDGWDDTENRSVKGGSPTLEQSQSLSGGACTQVICG
jgi:hypothetical protein